MSGALLISVVMSVLNDERYVAATVDSILSQEDVDLEFIVIDDGSADRTGEILDAYAVLDLRLRVFHQENTGLTRALIRGCALARGKYIARQDAGGDISLPGRLRTQMEFLESHPDVVMTSCGTRFLGPEGEVLQEVVQFGSELQASLEDLAALRSRGPSHHASTMFRRSAYESVGGYRAAFAVAQDQDLWLRLAERGKCIAVPEVLYIARLSRGSISADNRNDQLNTMKQILACARLRRSGMSDEQAIQVFADTAVRRAVRGRFFRSIRDAQFYYFIGCLLREQHPKQARAYFRKSLQTCFFYPRAIVRLCLPPK